MLTRILAYGFAFFLLFLEWLLRKLSNIDSHEFMDLRSRQQALGSWCH